MKKIFSLSLVALLLSYASYALSPFTPSTGTVCIGSSIYLTDSLDPGGTWTSSNTAIATIGSSSGIMTGVSAGVVTITYTLSSAFVTGTFTVSAAPSPIVGGTSSFCVGSTITLTDATPGGTWYSGSTYIATVGATTGIVTGMHGGVVNIYYSVGGCSVSRSVTVDATPTPVITGPTTVCVGGTITLADTSGTLTGTWSSSSTGTATVGASTGIVTGVSAGTVVITFTVTGACGTTSATRTITVTSTTTPGTITGPSAVTAGSTITLYATPGGGTWSSSPTTIATVAGGVVSGVSAGVATITYTITGCSGPASSYKTVSVNPFDGISGNVIFSTPSFGPVKVWLITFDTATNLLEAVDSISSYVSGTTYHYQFTGVPTDSYRVKAAFTDSMTITTGFIPTYHTGDFYWYNATVIPHVSGTADINKHINMAVGTITSGPGFIAGDVTTGANKGTAGASPSVGMHLCVVNSSTMQIVQQTNTDATGHYSFNNLPVGQTYFVFPDSMNFITTPYTAINLTASTPSVSYASFVQHTISKTITPVFQAVNDVKPAASAVTVFPNPSNGKLFVRWEVKAAEKANVTISDVTGRIVYSNTVNMHEGTGVQQIALPELINGSYIVNIQSATISYKHTLQVQH